MNFTHASYGKKSSINKIDREIKMGELRLKYVQLMREVHSTLGDEDAYTLIIESEKIWNKLNDPANDEK